MRGDTRRHNKRNVGGLRAQKLWRLVQSRDGEQDCTAKDERESTEGSRRSRLEDS
jgi:hypothetical protein